MPIVFKYKNPLNLSYAPGIVKYGQDGDVGQQGEAGNAMYFTDFDFDNSYDIELALQKIENNYVLSSDVISQLMNIRPYKVNDLILSSTGKCYKLILSTGTSVFKNYKYDIEYLGHIYNNTPSQLLRVEFENITDSSTAYNSIQPLPIKANRENFDIDDSEEDKKTTRGVWYKIRLTGTKASPDYFFTTDASTTSGLTPKEIEYITKFINSIVEAQPTACRYSIEMKIKNSKSFISNLFPGEYDNLPTLDFYTTLSFSNLDLYFDSTSSRGSSGGSESHEEDTEINQYCHETIVYISDYMLDRLHNCGNNLSCSLNDEKTRWYKSGIRGDDNIITINHDILLGDIDYNYNKYSDIYGDNKIPCDETVEKYTKSNNYKEDFIGTRCFKEGDETIIVNGSKSLQNFPKYTTGGEELDDVIFIDPIGLHSKIQTALNDDVSSNILIKEKRDSLAGDSLFFSSISNETICNEINRYLFSTDTKIIVTTKNLNTKEITVSEIPYTVKM